MVSGSWSAVALIVRSPEFEHGPNSGLAIRAKNAILFVEDSPATQIPTLQPSAPNRRELFKHGEGLLSSRNRVRRNGLQKGLPDIECGPSGMWSERGQGRRW
jgi:hypothetical protein